MIDYPAYEKELADYNAYIKPEMIDYSRLVEEDSPGDDLDV